MSKQYRHAALGGTFDRLHIGHQHLLNTASKYAHKMTIGLTTAALIEHKKHAHIITDYCQRKNELKTYLKKLKFLSKSNIIPLHDLYGTTLSDKTIDAIAVTPQTKPGAIKINKKRSSLGLTQLPVITASLIKDDDGDYISSTKIRHGLINRQGNVYSHVFKKDITLSSKQKSILKSPQGELITKAQDIKKVLLNNSHTALIGDYITQFCIDHKLPFNYAIVDYSNNRLPFNIDFKWWHPKHILHTKNARGVITSSASSKIYKALSFTNALVEVDGEEDLLGFPAVLFMPLDSLVLYGQPREGVVMIRVSESVKENLVRFINQT